MSIGRRIRDILPATINAGPENGRWNLSVRPRSLGPLARNPGTEPPLGCGISRNSLSLSDKGIGVSCGQPSALVDPVFVFRQNAGGGARVPKPCTERDRLRQAYYQATLEVSASCGALPSTPFGPEFTAALKKAEAAQRASDASRLAYEKHCAEHGCETKRYRPRW